MSEIVNLIDSRVQKALSNNTSIVNTIPCRVEEVLENRLVRVTLLSNGMELIVPNWSGNDVAVEENVQLFYSGNIVSARNSYIGASLYKGLVADDVTIRYLECNVRLGEVFETDRDIITLDFLANRNTNVFVCINADVQGSENGLLSLMITMNDETHNYIPSVQIIANQTKHLYFSVPFYVLKGDCSLEVKANGTGNLTNIYAYVWGQAITIVENYEPTDENDYIFEEISSVSNIIYYISDKINPEVPTTLNDKETNIIRATSFTDSDVELVYIPDGITEIE